MSKIKPYLYDVILVAMTILFAAILTGCGRSPNLEELDPNADLNDCRAVLEEVQSGSYHISICRDFLESDNGLNSFTLVDYWKSGGDWLHIAKPDGDIMFFANLCKNGLYFDNEDNPMDSREYDIKWFPASVTPGYEPWLATCRWDDQEVSHISTGYAGSSRVVKIAFNTPYILGDNVSDPYTVDFFFDKKGNFEKAELTAQFHSEQSGDIKWKDTYTIISTDTQEVTARLQKEYDSALNQQGTATSETQEYLDACRAVLEEIQSHDSYHITIEAENGASKFTNQYFLHGEDKLFIGDSQNKNNAWAGVDSYLRRNGELFEAEMPGMGHDLNAIQWTGAKYFPDDVENYIPWIYDIDWDAQEVSLVSQSFGPGGGSIDVLFKTPYVFQGGLKPVTENYTVQFIMDSAMNLREAIMRASYHHENPEYQEYDFMMTQVFTVSTDEAEIAARIDQEYQRALAQNNMTE